MFTKSATNMRNIPHKLKHGMKEAEEAEKRDRTMKDGAEKAYAIKLLNAETERNTNEENRLAASMSMGTAGTKNVQSLRDLIINQSVSVVNYPQSQEGRELDYSRLMTPNRDGMVADSALSPSMRGSQTATGVHLPQINSARQSYAEQSMMLSPANRFRGPRKPILLGNQTMGRTSFQLQEVKKVVVKQAVLFKAQNTARGEPQFRNPEDMMEIASPTSMRRGHNPSARF